MINTKKMNKGGEASPLAAAPLRGSSATPLHEGHCLIRFINQRFPNAARGFGAAGKRFLPGMLMVCVIFFSGCERIKEAYSKVRSGGPGGPGGPGAPPQEAPVFAVNTTIASWGQIRDYIALSGDIVAGSSVDTYSEAAGKITRVYVTIGQRVNRGAPVAAIDPSRPGMDYRANIATAPISGIVVSLPAQVGMTISQSIPLARISGGGALELRLFVAERFISKMAMNLPCEITLDAWPGEMFQGSVREIAPTVDPASRTMEVKVNVNNAGSKLKAGMFAKVRIITERKENIVKIPASAALNRYGEQYVFAVDRNSPEGAVARRRQIIPGIIIDGVMEVQSGLSPNEEIIIRGQTLLEDGSRINVIEQIAPLGD